MLISLSAATVLCSSAHAAPVFWNVAGPSDWTIPGNWTPAAPIAGDTAIIDNGGSAFISADLSGTTYLGANTAVPSAQAAPLILSRPATEPWKSRPAGTLNMALAP